MVGAMTHDGGAPDSGVFSWSPHGDYTVRDTWFTAGMRGTGSKTIVTDDVFVPELRMLRSGLICGRARARAPHGTPNPIFRTPFFFYAPLDLRSAHAGRGAGGLCAVPRVGTKPRKSVDGSAVAEKITGAGADGARRR